MSQAAVLAFGAGGAAVLAAWDVLGALHEAQAAGAARRALAPLARAGLVGTAPTVGETRRIWVLVSGTALAGGWLLAGAGLGVLLAVAGPLAVGQVVAYRRRRWREELATGASAAARALADALTAGHAPRGAIEQAAASGAVPGAAGRLLGDAAVALALGRRTVDVLEDARSRAGGPEWDALVAAVLLTRESGGDLSALLRSLAVAQEEARRTEADARSLTAQARFTAHLVCGLPLIAVVLAELVSPGYLADLAGSPLTLALLVLAALLQGTALAVVSRMAKVV